MSAARRPILFLTLFAMTTSVWSKDAQSSDDGSAGAASSGVSTAASSSASQSNESPAQPTVPTLTSDRVALFSNAFAGKRIGAFRYEVTQLTYEVQPGSMLWTIHYELGPAPDGSKPEPAQFDVLLEDRTGKLRFADEKP